MLRDVTFGECRRSDGDRDSAGPAAEHIVEPVFVKLESRPTDDARQKGARRIDHSLLVGREVVGDLHSHGKTNCSRGTGVATRKCKLIAAFVFGCSRGSALVYGEPPCLIHYGRGYRGDE